MNKDIIDKYSIKTLYKYKEVQNGKEIQFGWVKATEVDLPAIISFDDISSHISDEDLEWSKNEGVNAVSVEDYKKYFLSLVREEPGRVLSGWDSAQAFASFWSSKDAKRELDSGLFIYKLAELIVNYKPFSMHGRRFKVIHK